MQVDHSEKQEYLKKVDVMLDIIRPHLLADGGNVEVIDITEEGILYIRFLGNCQHCTMSDSTLKAGIWESLRIHFPDIVEVRQAPPFNEGNAQWSTAH